MVVKRKIEFNGAFRDSIEGELLYIGKNQYTDNDFVAILLDNYWAAKLMEKGYNVRCRLAGGIAYGRILEETILYVCIDIPRALFVPSKFDSLKLDYRMGRRPLVTVDLKADSWTNYRTGKKSLRLFLEEIYLADYGNEEEDLAQEIRDLHLAMRLRVNEIRVSPALRDGASTPKSGAAMYREAARQLSQREYENRNNPLRTYWNRGDSVVIDELEYVVHDIVERGDTLSVRLDRKFQPSKYLRVPK